MLLLDRRGAEERRILGKEPGTCGRTLFIFEGRLKGLRGLQKWKVEALLS
jgi:hypothetical protein